MIRSPVPKLYELTGVGEKDVQVNFEQCPMTGVNVTLWELRFLNTAL